MTSTPWEMPLIGQGNPDICWEAVGHMMWQFRHGKMSEGKYRKACGQYLNVQTGLKPEACDQFYRQLGMHVQRGLSLDWITHQIHLGPVVLIMQFEKYAHAVIYIGKKNDLWLFVNPEGRAKVTFDVDDSSKITDIKATIVEMKYADFSTLEWAWFRPESSIRKLHAAGG